MIEGRTCGDRYGASSAKDIGPAELEGGATTATGKPGALPRCDP
jgi:hypothetical protein